MPAALPNPTDCCAVCDDVVSVSTPGPAGPAGADGTNGTNGVNAYAALTAQFTMPASGASLAGILVTDSTYMGINQTLYVENAGFMQVTAKASSVSITLKNLGYTGNAAGGAVIANGSKISPGGLQGTAGSTSGAAGGDLKGTYPNPKLLTANTKGSTLSGNGTDTIAVAVGTDGKRIKADSTQAAGVQWALVDLANTTEVTGALPVANGGTGAATAANARINLGLASTPSDWAVLREYQVAGTSAGTFTTGAWRTRTLNSYNTFTGALPAWIALAANQFTLQPGTYRITFKAPAYEVDSHQAKIRNITDGTDQVLGSSARAAAAADCTTESFAIWNFVIAGAKVFELQHYCQTTKATSGFGLAANLGLEEHYALVFIEKLG